MESTKIGAIGACSPIQPNEEAKIQTMPSNNHEILKEEDKKDTTVTQIVKIKSKFVNDDREIIFSFDINPNLYRIKSIICGGNPRPLFSFTNVAHKKVNLDDKDEIPPPEVAIKKISNIFSSKQKALNTLRELRILATNWHPKITKLIDIFGPEKENFSDIYFVMEKLDSNLFEVIKSGVDYSFNPNFIPFVIYQILIALKYLHSSKLMHNDIRPSNILIDSNSHIKICNFGKATEYENIFEFSSVFKPEYLFYLSPEVLGNKISSSFTEKLDLWGVGCILLELLSKKSPFFLNETVDQRPRNRWKNQYKMLVYTLGSPDDKEIEPFFSQERYKQIQKIKKFPKKSFKELVPNASEDAIELLKGLLEFNPNKRFTVDEALKQNYLKEFTNLKEAKEADEYIDLSFMNDELFMDDDNTMTLEQQEKIRNKIIEEYNNFYDD